MTKLVFGFIAAGGFVYLVASQTQIGWLYLFDAVIWSLLVLSAVLPRYSLKSLRIERQVLLLASNFRQSQLGGPVEGDAVEVKLKVTNNGRLARHFIKVLEDCPFGQPEERHKAFFIASLKPRSMTVFSYTATCYRRGYYTSSNATLQSSGPLGLLARHRTFELPLNLTVYPTYYQVEGLPVADAAWVDWGHTVKSNAAAEFYGSREYQRSDPLKHIHWRNTARLGRFMLKEFEQASQGSVTVVFGTKSDFGIGRETTLEYSIKIAASLAKLCADSGRSIDIITSEKPLHNAGWREAMDYLAHLEVGGKVGLAELTPTPEPGQVVVAIVPTIETKLAHSLYQLADRVQRLAVILLEGFSADETPNEFLSRLKRDSLNIIICSRGNLEGAIHELASSPLFADKSPAPVG